VSGHLDLDALADALEAEPVARGHLVRCPACAARLEELRAAEADVAASLAALPPPIMPAGLVERIQAALAAEPPLSPTAGRARAAGAATVTPLPRSSRRRARRDAPFWLPAAAAAVVLVAGVGLGVLLFDGGGSSSNTDSSATSASAGAPPSPQDTVTAVPTSATGTDYARPPAVAAALPGVLGAPAVRLGAAGQSLRSADAAASTSGKAQAAPGSDPVGPAAAPEGSGGLDRLHTPSGLDSCLDALLPPEQPGQEPLALDYARYGGQPALAVVLPDPDPAKVAVFVVGAGCRGDDDATLFFTRVDKPR